MAKIGNNWKSNRWGEQRREEYSWQDTEFRHDYSWLKKIVVAAVIFIGVYCAHISETTLGTTIDEAIHYTLSAQVDLNEVVEQVVSHVPPSIDRSVLKKVQMVVSKPADPLLYMSKPVAGKIISPFGWRVHPISKQEMMHEGIDIEAVLGTNIRAAAAGKVKAVTETAQYGKMIILEHGQDVDTLYGHLGEIIVNQGDTISQGQVIGRVGKSGMVSGPTLYFELREKGKAIDPETRLKGDFPTVEGK
ncbi:M23 family metallopeptidase [Pelosinus sp. sgz500959]|uniref:M23 family metallopeptidase n=1 Tax=Pelosinus sp. sgz500959 TaxID=3242472 RepID=UPI00366DCF0B